MNLDLTKLVLSVCAGVLALGGGLLTFLNGRLNEAKTPEDRSWVLRWTLFGIVTGLSVLGVVLGIIYNNIFLYLAFFAPTIVANIGLFLRNSAPPSRKEIVGLVLTISLFSTTVAVAITLHFAGRLLGLLEKMVH